MQKPLIISDSLFALNHPSTGEVTIRIPNYGAMLDTGATTCTVHARMILLDSQTGYRSQYQSLSATLELTR